MWKVFVALTVLAILLAPAPKKHKPKPKKRRLDCVYEDCEPVKSLHMKYYFITREV